MWYRASHARRLWQTEHTAGGIQEGKNERGSRGGNHLKGWMLVVPKCSGVLVPTFLDRWAATKVPQRGKGRAVPECCSSICSTCCQSMVEIPEAVVHERDLSIKCIQSAVSESKTTQAARRRECTAPRHGGGAHARDSSIARCTRPSAVRHSTQ
jgi:hypothetical protein